MLVIGGGYRYYGNVETHYLNLKLIIKIKFFFNNLDSAWS